MNYIISYIIIYFSFNLYCIDVLFKFNYTYIIILGCNSDNEVWNCIWLYTNYSNSFTTNSIIIHKGNKIYYLLDIYRDEGSHGFFFWSKRQSWLYRPQIYYTLFPISHFLASILSSSFVFWSILASIVFFWGVNYLASIQGDRNSYPTHKMGLDFITASTWIHTQLTWLRQWRALFVLLSGIACFWAVSNVI